MNRFRELFAASLSQLISNILFLIIALFLIYRLHILYGELPQSAAADPQAEELFHHLQEKNLLNISETGVIELPPQDAALAVQAENKITDKQQLAYFQDLLDLLYFKAPGKRVQQQIEIWNNTRELAAIRDNFQGNNPAYLWQAEDEQGHTIIGTNNGRVPLEFGFLNQGKLPKYFNGWLSVGKQKKAVTFQKTFALPQKQTFRIDIIGTPEISHLSNYQVEVRKSENEQQKRCTGESAQTYSITLTLPAGKHTLRIPTRPTVNPVTEVEGVALSYQPNGKEQPGCDQFAKGDKLLWQSEKMHTSSQGATVTVESKAQLIVQTADKISLLEYNPQMGANNAAVKLGLLPLIGEDKYDVYSLSGMSGSLNEDTKIVLTINGKLQQAALKILADKYTTTGKTASLVLLDANNGDILTAAAVPLAPEHVSVWDRQVFSKLYPQKDPYLFVPWQGLGRFSAPGSIFKLVTAVALFQAAENNPTIEQAIYGMNAKQLARLGIYTNGQAWQSHYKIPSVSNYSKSAMSKIVFNQTCGKISPPQKWSLLDMLGNSYNTWFAALTEMADSEALIHDNPEESYLVKTAHRFGYDAIFSLQPKSLSLNRIQPQKTKLGNFGSRGDVLNAFGGQMDFTLNIQGLRANQLARLSYGQAQATTPLTMALVSASLSQGKFVRPRLFQKINGKTVKTEGFQKIGISEKALNWLRLGMKGVVQGGTARYAFPKPKHAQDLGCRVYAKTGTADAAVGKRHLGKSAWMTGYVEDKEQQPTVAFSCMVQNSKSGGGTECGPLVNKLLTEYEKLTQQEEQKP